MYRTQMLGDHKWHTHLLWRCCAGASWSLPDAAAAAARSGKASLGCRPGLVAADCWGAADCLAMGGKSSSIMVMPPVRHAGLSNLIWGEEGRGARFTFTSHHIITSHHITSHHITSHHITSHHITSHHITSHHITSHHITSHHITSHHITSHHITSHQHHYYSG